MEQIGDDLESPESLESRASVRSSLTSFAAVSVSRLPPATRPFQSQPRCLTGRLPSVVYSCTCFSLVATTSSSTI
ncbi:hypothetical protein AArcCO_2763 [Halalkaliarchaeum sp. AArc-CO]|nr:hypothetical protein AArcCO_2763 [Halalkaliarchaeum sp. AArc-CO]